MFKTTEGLLEHLKNKNMPFKTNIHTPLGKELLKFVLKAEIIFKNILRNLTK